MTNNDLKINAWLKDHYGISLDGRPKFRVVWSTGLTEKRFGEFNEFLGSTDILLRRFKGVREVPKYPFYKDRWILEKLEYIGDNKELIEKSGYEPIFVFQTSEGQFLPLEHRAISFYMHFYMNRGKLASPSDLEEEERKKYEKEVEYFKEFLKDSMSDPMQMQLVE